MASIEKRSDHSYRLVVSCGYGPDGKKIKKTKPITVDPELTPKQLEKELQRQAVIFEEEVRRGTYLDGNKTTFADFTERWLKDYAEKSLAPKTLYRYVELLETRILPALGHFKLGHIQPNHLLELYNNLTEPGIRLDSKYLAKPDFKKTIEEKKLTTEILSESSGVSVKTIKSMLKGNPVSRKTATSICKVMEMDLNKLFTPKGEPKGLSDQSILHCHRLIHTVLETAVQWQAIASNPAGRVKSPKVERKRVKFYDEVEAEKLLEALEAAPLKYKTALNLALNGGMRLGELSAMTWNDIDFDNCLIRIEQASQYLPGKGSYIKDPKNESSIRIISMPPSVIDLLKQYRAWQNQERLKCGDLWQDKGFIFTQWNGEPIFVDTISKWFSKFRKRNNLPDLAFHQTTRHTNASLLISQGVNIQTVSKRLGHARTSTTTDIYAHALKRPDKEAADKLENLFNKKNGQKEKQA